MKKIIVPALFILTFIGFNNIKSNSFSMVKAETYNPYISQLIYEENSDGTLSVIGVKEQYLTNSNFRIYSYNSDLNKTITSIKLSAFTNVNNLTSLMISNSIKSIDEGAISVSTLTTIYYTGSIDEWGELNYVTNTSVLPYSFDEGFINYWNLYVRPSAESSVCDISKDRYLELKNMYNILGQLDKENVDNYEDLSGDKISESIEYMDTYFNPKKEETKQNKISKDVALSIVIGIAIFGMTSIAIFYLLMKKNIIS